MKSPQDLISDLLIAEDADLFPLPKWAQYFTLIGYQLASLDRKDFSKLFVIFLLPSLRYAAIFLAMGAVLQRLLKSSVDEDAILEKFKRLNIGHPLKYRSETYWLKGKYRGISERMGDIYIDVLTAKGRKGVSGWLEHFIPLARANTSLEILDGDFKLPGEQKGKKLRNTNTFTNMINKYGYPVENLFSGKRLDCLIIGNKVKIIKETKSTKLVLVNPEIDKPCEGWVSDIIRPKELMHYHEAYRTKIAPSASKRAKRIITDSKQYITIFDGSNSYINWMDITTETINVVLLDRTENQINTAIDNIRFAYAQRNELEVELDIPDIIPGVEYTYFEV